MDVRRQQGKIALVTGAASGIGGGGHVVNVASMAPFTPNDQLCCDTASKYTVLGLSG